MILSRTLGVLVNKLPTTKAKFYHADSNIQRSSIFCSIYGTTFNSPGNLRKHKRSQSDAKPFSCSICYRSFTQSEHLEIHMRIHSDSRSYECIECGFKFKVRSLLQGHYSRTHSKSQESEQANRCSVCEKTFSRAYYLKLHMRRHENTANSELLYSCSDKKYAFTKDLLHHIHCQSGTYPHYCQVCGEGFATKRYLTRHESIHAEALSFQCTVCPMSFRTEQNFKRHLLLHDNERNLLSTQCNDVFDTSKAVSTHMAYVHEEAAIASDGHGDLASVISSVPYVPNMPHPSFKQTPSFHLALNKRGNFLDESNHECEVCLKIFKYKHTLVKHKKRFHPELWPYVCKVCGFGCESENALHFHEKEHAESSTRARLNCNICGKTFSSDSTLRSHMKLHSEARETFPCSQCDKVLSSNTTLTRHVKTVHRKIQSSYCVICCAPFSSAWALSVHMKRKHDVEDFKYKCDQCDSKFKYFKDLRNHSRVSHLHSDFQLPSGKD